MLVVEMRHLFCDMNPMEDEDGGRPGSTWKMKMVADQVPPVTVQGDSAILFANYDTNVFMNKVLQNHTKILQIPQNSFEDHDNGSSSRVNVAKSALRGNERNWW